MSLSALLAAAVAAAAAACPKKAITCGWRAAGTKRILFGQPVENQCRRARDEINKEEIHETIYVFVIALETPVRVSSMVEVQGRDTRTQYPSYAPRLLHRVA